MHKYAEIRCQSNGFCVPLKLLAVPEQVCSLDSHFENLLVTAGLGFLVYIHTETPVINHCGVALFCYLEQGIVLPENSSCTGENLLLKFL